MTTMYAAIKWPLHATQSDIRRTLPNELELLVLTLVEEKGFKVDDVWEMFEDAWHSASSDLSAHSEGHADE